MALTVSSAKQEVGPGLDIKVFLDGEDRAIQAVALTDANGDQIGISGSAIPVVEANSAAALAELKLKADLTETQPVSAAVLPLPTGAATQLTLAALLTELALKADPTETQNVAVVSALPAGTNAIGKLAANSGVAIGDVDVTSISAGENHIGQVGSPGKTISLTPAVTAGAYTAGDAVGGLLTFADAARVAAKGGVVKGVVIIDDAGQDAEIELWLFNQTFTAMADNAPWAPSEADLEKCIGVISTSTSDRGWMAAGTPSLCDIEVARRYDLIGTSLFGQLVTRGTPTFAATDDVTVKVMLLQD